MHVLENDRGSNIRLGDFRKLWELKKGLPLTQKKTSNRVTAGHKEEMSKGLVIERPPAGPVFECFLLSWWCSVGEVVQPFGGRTGRRKWVAGGQALRLRDKTYFISSLFASCSRDMWWRHDREHVSRASQSPPAIPFPVMDSDDFEPQNQSEALFPSVASCQISGYGHDTTWLEESYKYLNNEEKRNVSVTQSGTKCIKLSFDKTGSQSSGKKKVLTMKCFQEKNRNMRHPLMRATPVYFSHVQFLLTIPPMVSLCPLFQQLSLWPSGDSVNWDFKDPRLPQKDGDKFSNPLYSSTHPCSSMEPLSSSLSPKEFLLYKFTRHLPHIHT